MDQNIPDIPYTKKPAETRMGKEKGNPEYWVAAVKPGTVMFEMSGIEPAIAKEALVLAGSKLPIRSKFIMRESWSRAMKESYKDLSYEELLKKRDELIKKSMDFRSRESWVTWKILSKNGCCGDVSLG
jgi:hypothetical protein